MNAMGTTGLMAGRLEFYTWREAVLTAAEISDRFSTVGKPRVRFGPDRWVVTYEYKPFAMNMKPGPSLHLHIAPFRPALVKAIAAYERPSA